MLELLKENDPQLSQPSTPWDFVIDGDPTELVTEMMQLMIEHNGIGLAAPQCGINKTIFIMGNSSKMVACINPKIVSLSENRIGDIEGCLSFPELWLKVIRPDACIVSYQNTLGELVQEELTGIMARVYLHEFDHLSGITFDQRVSDMKLKMAKETRTKTIKKKSRASV